MMRTTTPHLATHLTIIFAGSLTAQVVTDREGRVGIGTLTPDAWVQDLPSFIELE